MEQRKVPEPWTLMDTGEWLSGWTWGRPLENHRSDATGREGSTEGTLLLTRSLFGHHLPSFSPKLVGPGFYQETPTRQSGTQVHSKSCTRGYEVREGWSDPTRRD